MVGKVVRFVFLPLLSLFCSISSVYRAPWSILFRLINKITQQVSCTIALLTTIFCLSISNDNDILQTRIVTISYWQLACKQIGMAIKARSVGTRSSPTLMGWILPGLINNRVEYRILPAGLFLSFFVFYEI